MTTHTHNVLPALQRARQPRTANRDRAAGKYVRADRAIAGAFAVVIAIYALGLWKLTETRDTEAAMTTIGPAAWGALLAFNAVMTVALFFTMAYRATVRSSDDR